MIRVLIALSILTSLGACGGTRYKPSSNPPQSSPGTSDPGEPDPGGIDPSGDPGSPDDGSDDPVDDPGSSDGGTVDPVDDPGSGDDGGGDMSFDPSEFRGSRGAAGLLPRITLEAVNYDAVPYVLYVRTAVAGQPRRKLFPPLPAAPSGSFSEASEPFRLRPGTAYSLVLKAPDGRTLDVRPVDAAEGVSKKSFSIVGSTLLASQG